jgi:hypothetical protein
MIARLSRTPTVKHGEHTRLRGVPTGALTGPPSGDDLHLTVLRRYAEGVSAKAPTTARGYCLNLNPSLSRNR